jgi:predicted dehydrogenase
MERVLIVGSGSMGQRHLRIVRSLLPDADIRVLSRCPLRDLPQGANDCLTNLDDAASFAPQIAVVANPAPFHIETAKVLLSLGAHLFIEKPLAESSHGVQELLETARLQRRLLQVGYNLRFYPSLRAFRDHITKKTVGRVLCVRSEVGSYLPAWRPGVDYRQGVSAQRALGGGVLLELSHEIDYLRWIFGDVSHVYASLSKQSSFEIDVEDTVQMILSFAGNTEGSQLAANLSMDFLRRDSVRQCFAIGERGTLRWNGLTGSVELFAEGAKQWESLFSKPRELEQSYTEEWQHFLDCVLHRTTPLVNGDDGFATLRVVDAARRSSESKTRTPVESTKRFK